jgi:hypothetical protein
MYVQRSWMMVSFLQLSNIASSYKDAAFGLSQLIYKIALKPSNKARSQQIRYPALYCLHSPLLHVHRRPENLIGRDVKVMHTLQDGSRKSIPISPTAAFSSPAQPSITGAAAPAGRGWVHQASALPSGGTGGFYPPTVGSSRDPRLAQNIMTNVTQVGGRIPPSFLPLLVQQSYTDKRVAACCQIPSCVPIPAGWLAAS